MDSGIPIFRGVAAVVFWTARPLFRAAATAAMDFSGTFSAQAFALLGVGSRLRSLG
jgi:hypothetical protein